MSDQPTSAESAVIHSTDLSSVESWHAVHREAGILGDEDAIVAISLRGDAIAPVAAAAITSVKFGLYSTEAEQRFDSVHVILPPGAQCDAIRRNTLQGVSDLMAQGGAPEIMVQLAPMMINTSSMISVSTEDLVHFIRSLPGRSAVILILADLYRTAGLLEESRYATGKSLQEITRDHLQWLLKALSAACCDGHRSAYVFYRRSRVAGLDIEEIKDQTVLLLEESGIPEDEISIEKLGIYKAAFLTGGWAAVGSLGALGRVDKIKI